MACMLDSPAIPTCILAVVTSKCLHRHEEKQRLSSFPLRWTFEELFSSFHPEPINHLKTLASTNLNGDNSYEIQNDLTLGSIVQSFGIKWVKFICQEEKDDQGLKLLQQIHTEATTKAVDAFQVLMSGGKVFPKKKTQSSGVKDGLSKKDELYNDLVQWCEKEGLMFPKGSPEQASYFVQVLCNALWYITNHQTTIDDAARMRKELRHVPTPFDQYTGYNDTKRKKMKSLPLNRQTLESHSQTLYSLLLKPYTNRPKQWQKVSASIKDLASCLSLYGEYLLKQSDVSASNKAAEEPVQTVDQHACVYHSHKTANLKEIYHQLDTAVLAAGTTPVIFNESVHLREMFTHNKQRERYFSQIQLSVPVDIIKYCPGGSFVTTFIITQVNENRSVAQMLTDGARLVQQMRPKLREVNTRAQKKMFKDKVANIAKIKPALLDFIYSELAIDAAAIANPEMMERLKIISLGESELMSDLRHLNPGRPNDKYDVFFNKLCELAEGIAAADVRRHGTGVAHLSQWISLTDMIEKAAKECPPGTLVPSKSLVRLQFAPSNPYSRLALRFTSKVPIQYKIQRRQLRKHHEDDHYCSALFKYLKSKALEVKDDAVLVCCDDKAKVPIGDPGRPVSTGVRGRQSLVPSSSDLSALDHDMNTTSLTPSVILDCKVPGSVGESFVRGTVTTFVNNTVLQPSSPFRHAAQLQKILEDYDKKPNILLKYTDGGTDQRNTLESVKCANISLFREFDFDMLIAVRCAPGQSYANPAERIMSVLNYGLQNVATERQEVDAESEKVIKRCGGAASVREMCHKKPDLKIAWAESVEPVQSLIRNRFLCLKLKDEPIRVKTQFRNKTLRYCKDISKNSSPV